jgi:hypothetical protein
MLIGQSQEREAIPNGFDHWPRLNRIGMGDTGIMQQARKIDSPLLSIDARDFIPARFAAWFQWRFVDENTKGKLHS